MRVFRPFTFALGAVFASVSASAESLLADWAPCGSKFIVSFECSVATLPLCHKGVCDSDKTVEVQVKRVAGTKTASKAVWVLTGGADASSSKVEGSLDSLARALDGQADVYTMDIRGTGNSTLLGCKATDKYTTGAAVDFRVVADCAKDIYAQMDEQPASFSVTSAAKDVVSLIGEHKGDVFVYGSGIGSYLAARVMHMAPDNVKGYVLDRVVSEKRGNFAYAGSNRQQAATELAALCDKSPDCRKNYGESLSEDLRMKDIWNNLATKYDEAKSDPKYAECTKLLCGDCKDVSPSDMVRKLLEMGVPASSTATREEIPDVMETLWNCDDVKVLQKRMGGEGSFAEMLKEFQAEQETATADPAKEGPAEFFTQLIKHSEIWAHPSRSWEDAKKSIQSTTFGAYQTYDYAWHCVLSGNMTDPSCSALKEYGEQLSKPIDFSTIKDMQSLLYAPDDYYSKFATIPDGSSALLMTSKLDFEMPASWAKEQMSEMRGDSIQLIEFETNAHGSEFINTTPEDHNDCGTDILASYVLGGGDLDQIDMSCFDKFQPIDFKDMQS
ncbi:hypothetical protein Poli38472_014760 [Pythium oligandrum]|uniref:AB hydrolase-1 domain-containing protein n=1 Tax=Pythium oligandrum TaxID=41045 RepID=A0A8K1FBM8_PYTOL|nr:hypothetical protein Poli38472_014760 [Pythium oligandrum]|eukprot:TMW54989.1 hypothetical protein Poli38472_014760 [Pythium oligandrum]